jgi:hypothetical protein
MKITFGIITNAVNGINDNLIKSVESIRNLKIPDYEIIIVGTESNLKSLYSDDVKIIDFNEHIKPGWITKKKNLITHHAQFNDIVYQHDYFAYDSDWYEGWKNFGDYKIGMNKLVNVNGERYRDHVIFHSGGLIDSIKPPWFDRFECLLPYEETGFSKIQYLSGAWWISKKHVMEEFPLDERLVWSQGEDLIQSYAIREKYNFSINTNSTAHLVKFNEPVFHLMRPQTLDYLKNKLINLGLYSPNNSSIT